MTNSKTSPNPSSLRQRRHICVAVAVFVVFSVVLLLILGLAVLRPKETITTVNSVELDGLRVGFSVSNYGVELNATLLLNISTTNPNSAGFQYENGTAELYYRRVLVGEVVIPEGEIGARETIQTVVRLTVLADRVIFDRSFYSDFMSGVVTMTTTTRVPGKATILGIFKHRLVMYTTCDVTIGIFSRKRRGAVMALGKVLHSSYGAKRMGCSSSVSSESIQGHHIRKLIDLPGTMMLNSAHPSLGRKT